MSQDPRFRVNFPIAASTRQEIPNHSETPSTSRKIQRGIRDISRTLAAHGAGAASTELALDLVLHEIAVDMREVTRATGASVAWVRGEQMVCRASTGDYAPQLGVRVEVESSLAGACVKARQIQVCPDTQAESRFEADEYVRAGVRSMLFAPISNEGELLGILQIFSSSPDVFGENEVLAIRPFIDRCIEAAIEAQRWRNEAEQPVTRDAANTEGIAVPSERVGEVETGSYDLGRNSRFLAKLKDLSNSMLLVAVLTVAIVLGLLIGWRKGSEQSPVSSGSASVPRPPIAVATDSRVSVKSSTNSSSPLPDSTADAIPAPPGTAGRVSPATPAGGLVIFQDGKIVYPTLEPKGSSAAGESPNNSIPGLVYRVAPEYPPQALARNVEGDVVLDVKVRGNGNVGDISVKSGNPLLRESAIAAVKQWRFAPYSGEADEMERQTRVTIKFILPVK